LALWLGLRALLAATAESSKSCLKIVVSRVRIPPSPSHCRAEALPAQATGQEAVNISFDGWNLKDS
jgi:hypothetical protein